MAARLPSLGRVAQTFRVILNPSQRSAQCLSQRNLHVSPCVWGDAVRVKMPSLSPTMYEGTIVQWLKKEGDSIAPGDIICDIQTDKAVVGFEIDEEGVLAKILMPENSGIIKIGTLIALMVEEGEDWQNVEIPADADASSPPDGSTIAESSTDAQEAVSSGIPGHHQGFGPAVKMLLSLYKIDPDHIKGTGPHNNIIKSDILQHITNNKLQPVITKPTTERVVVQQQDAQPPSITQDKPSPAPTKPPPPPGDEVEYVDIDLTNMRKVIAKRLTESKMSTPHAYSTIDCNIGTLTKLRKDLIADGIKVSVNDFIIKAAAVALQRVPQVNASWADDGIKMHSNIDISVAVATDSGLITPIIKDAINLGVQDISTTIKELAGRAKEGRLKPEEFQGGTFTISNLGMFGVSEFTAIINPPQACIMAVGTSRVELGPDGEPQTMMRVTVSADTRAVDEVIATTFLETFRDVIQNPVLMIGLSPKIDLQRLFAK